MTVPPTPEIPPPAGGLCGAKRLKPGPDGEVLYCTQRAGWGTQHPGVGNCRRHSGATPNGNTAAARRRVADITNDVRRQLGGFYGLNAPEAQVNPVEVLAEELARCRAVVAWIEAMVAKWSYDRDYDAADERAGGLLTEASIGPDGEAIPGETVAPSWRYGRLPELRQTGLPPLLTVVHGDKSSTVSDSEYRAWLRQLGEERDRLRVTAKLCLDAGLDERMTRVAESGGLMIVQALAMVLGWMGLSERQAELDRLVPQALEAVHESLRVGA